jgi:hypothetical protein
LSREKSRLSIETSNEIRDLSSETVRDIRDLSNYTSVELSREKSRLSIETSTEIRDLSSETARDIIDLSNYTSVELSLEKSRLSVETSTEISDLRSETIRDIADLSGYTSSELSRQISDLSSESVRDISDLSHVVHDLIGSAPLYLDTLEEIAYVIGNVTEPSGGVGTIIQKIYSVSQDIYDLSQTVAGVDSDYRNLNGRLTVNTYSVTQPAETTGLNVINGDISLNRTFLMYNKDNIIIGNASTGDTIKSLDGNYSSKPQGNIIIGSSADISNASIQFSTGIGHGIDLSGTGSTALGYLAKTDGLNSTAIGYNSKAIGDNVIQLGNTQVEYVNTNGVVTMSSDERLKANISTIPYALEKVSALRGVTYTRKDLPNKETVYMGLIAQETEKVVPEVVNNNGEYKSIMYNSLVGLLVEAVKDLDHNHKQLDGKQNNLEREITKIKTVIRNKLLQLNRIKNLVDVKDKK